MVRACSPAADEASRWITVLNAGDYGTGAVACGSSGWRYARRWPTMHAHSEVRFCTSADGTRLATTVSGAGLPLVAVRLWSAVEVLEAPIFTTRHWVEELSKDFRYARYDPRGVGLSERQMTRCTVDAWVEDLAAVIDALGEQPVALLAFSHASAVAIRYAAQRPERVSHLIICGGCARGMLKRGENEQALNAARAMIQTAEAAYGNYGPLAISFRRSYYLRWRPQFTTEMLDTLDAVVLDRVGKVGFAYTAAAHDVDVSPEARQVRCPTLVLHAHEDAFIPFDEGRLLASLIPRARLVSLACANHLPLENDPEWPIVLHEIRKFLASGMTASTTGRPPPAIAPVHRATARQIEVLRLISQGQTDKQIARALGLSHRTVEMHVGRLLESLKCHTRAEAVGVATQLRLLE